MTKPRLCCPSAPPPHSHSYLSSTRTSDTSNIYSMLPFSFCIISLAVTVATQTATDIIHRSSSSSSTGFHLISTFYHTILCTLCQLIFGQNSVK
ncbi:hypothetical protein B0H10DRAFT_2021633 [Mycena sp. CBHHK59/15]|nr:hypothetical protein B0H10DRAFT_2021633 [Mycena sp. CBHHK59/15]